MTDRSGRKWKVHSPGMLKINVDGSVNIKNPGCGLGIVVRNDKRDCLEARCVYLNNSSSLLVVELLAIKEGLKTARGMRYSNFILESDCAQAVVLIENFDRGCSNYDSYLSDIKILCANLNVGNLSFTVRECNMVAHVLARLAMRCKISARWSEDFSFSVLSACTADLG